MADGNTGNPNLEDDILGDLEDMFKSDEEDMKKMEQVVLTQNLEGFASCFPAWNLHPPVKR